jgi:cellulose synthase/poly-beta-1,6-N-acetylglucosamine synthase-like glycosyltransferase
MVSKRVNWIKYAKINSFFFLLTTVTLTILTLLTVNLFLMFKLKKMMLDNLFIKSFYKVMIIISFLPIFILVWISPQAMEGFILIRKDEEESNGSDYA